MTPEDRPWYGSSSKGEYRLLDSDSESDEDQLLRVCQERSTKPAIETFRGFEYVDTIDLRNVDQPTRKELICLFASLLILLQREDWIPDLEIQPKNGIVEMKNWLLDRSGVPKIIDFTSYTDVFRLSERRLQWEHPRQVQRLVEALQLLS